jgi:N-acetyl-gamma-glutamyl-phosphate reductase
MKRQVVDSEATKVAVGVVGARGYSGLELCRILLSHPGASLKAAFAQSEFKLCDYLPEKAAASVKSLAMNDLVSSVKDDGLELVFLATPAEASINLAAQLLELGVSVIDLSGAFRLQEGSPAERAQAYRDWYGFEHPRPDLVAQAEFGLMPWIGQALDQEIGFGLGGKPRLVANPGCFATASMMAVLPLLRRNLVEPSSLVIDAKSGTTGAGKKAEERLLHSEVDGLCLPYRVGRHQHEPEIRQFVKKWAQTEIEPFFTTHLLNVRRGIVASVYARAVEGLTSARVYETFAEAYGSDPLVEFGDLDRGAEGLLNLRRVVGSARTQLAFRVVSDRLFVFSLIDNLMKGAASQAVENFNRLLGVPSWTGLAEKEGVL